MLGLLALLISTGGFAVPAIPGRDGTFRACYNRSTGALRVVDADRSGRRNRCSRRERAVSWNQRGRPGQPGAQGERGLAGSDASINGVAAGGDLSGTFPSPTIAGGAVNSATVADGTLGLSDLNVRTGLGPSQDLGPVAANSCTFIVAALGAAGVQQTDAVFVNPPSTPPYNAGGRLQLSQPFVDGSNQIVVNVCNPTTTVSTDPPAIQLRYVAIR